MSFGSVAISASARAGKKSERNADIIEFVEAPWGLKMTLFPVQRVILKAHYGLELDDEEIFQIGKPYWENLVRSSNMKDYGSFTKDFSTQMLFGANEVELGKQWANNELITNLSETYEPFGTLRRGDHITVLIKQTNKKIPGEFLGRLVLGVEDGQIKVFGATIY